MWWSGCAVVALAAQVGLVASAGGALGGAGARLRVVPFAPSPSVGAGAAGAPAADAARGAPGEVRLFSGLRAQATPVGITAGRDGAMWFTEYGNGKAGALPRRARPGIGRITRSGRIREFTRGIHDRSGPTGITAGPDGALWFTEFDGNRVGRISRSGRVREFPAFASDHPLAIVTGPDHNLWFTETTGTYETPQLGRLTPHRRFAIKDFDLTELRTGGMSSFTVLDQIAADAHNLYVTAEDGDRRGMVGFYAPDSAGRLVGVRESLDISAEGIPGWTPGLRLAGAHGIAVGLDGTAWAALTGGDDLLDLVARIPVRGDPTYFFGEHGGRRQAERMWSLAAGHDGSIWFTEIYGGDVGRIGRGGQLSEWHVPGVHPESIAVAGDGSAWFTDPASNRIGRVRPPRR